MTEQDEQAEQAFHALLPCPRRDCWSRAQAPHPCPLRADIDDDTATLCECCKECQQNCADDI